MAAGDLSRVIELEESKMELASQIESIKREMERLREDKNREIEDLRKALDAAERATMQGADALLSKLWQRLAQLKPALVEGHVTPDVLTAERVFDAVFFLTEFSNAIDEEVRVFLSKYTNHESPLREPWNAYAARGTVRESVQKALAPGSGAIDPLRVRLNLLHLWVSAVTAANDSAIESIGSELKDQLLGAEVVGADQNVTVKNYYRQGLHNTFMDSMRRYRNKKMADIYAVGKDRGANS
jgi:hypothetical protein